MGCDLYVYKSVWKNDEWLLLLSTNLLFLTAYLFSDENNPLRVTLKQNIISNNDIDYCVFQ